MRDVLDSLESLSSPTTTAEADASHVLWDHQVLLDQTDHLDLPARMESPEPLEMEVDLDSLEFQDCLEIWDLLAHLVYWDLQDHPELQDPDRALNPAPRDLQDLQVLLVCPDQTDNPVAPDCWDSQVLLAPPVLLETAEPTEHPVCPEAQVSSDTMEPTVLVPLVPAAIPTKKGNSELDLSISCFSDCERDKVL